MVSACDCSPECCKSKDTTNHYHTGDNCFHPNGEIHAICKDNTDNSF